MSQGTKRSPSERWDKFSGNPWHINMEITVVFIRLFLFSQINLFDFLDNLSLLRWWVFGLRFSSCQPWRLSLLLLPRELYFKAMTLRQKVTLCPTISQAGSSIIWGQLDERLASSWPHIAHWSGRWDIGLGFNESDDLTAATKEWRIYIICKDSDKIRYLFQLWTIYNVQLTCSAMTVQHDFTCSLLKRISQLTYSCSSSLGSSPISGIMLSMVARALKVYVHSRMNVNDGILSVENKFYQCLSVPEKSDSGIDAEIIDDLENLYHPRHHYGCGRAKAPYCLIEIGGRQLRHY